MSGQEAGSGGHGEGRGGERSGKGRGGEGGSYRKPKFCGVCAEEERDPS